MPNIICPTKVPPVCPCFDADPVANFSSEAPDRDAFITNFDFDGTDSLTLNQSFEQLSCLGICESTVSQEAADDCARKIAQLCAEGTWRDQHGFTGRGRNGTPITLFSNSFQSCTVLCPDGSSFGWTVGPGTVLGRTQLEADELARNLACQRAQRHRICILTSSLPLCCQGQSYSSPALLASGGASPYVFSIVGGSLPSGFSIDPGTGIISGVTGDAAEVAMFTVQASDQFGFFQTKQFTITVVANTTTLLPATAGIAYSQQMTIGPAHDVTTEIWSSFGGPLPPGLTISPSGLIAGTPTGSTGAFPLLLEVTASFGAAGQCDCIIPVTLTVLIGIPLPIAYWKMEESNVSRVDQIANLKLNQFSGNIPKAPGKVGNAAQMTSGVGAPFMITPATTQMALRGNGGFTVCGWIKMTGPTNDAFDFQILFEGIALWDAQFTVAGTNTMFIFATDLNGLTPSVQQAMPVGSFFFFRSWFDPVSTTIKLQINNGPIVTSAINGLNFAGMQITSSAEFQFIGNAAGRVVLVDEIGVWMPALTDDQATALYNNGMGHTCCPIT